MISEDRKKVTVLSIAAVLFITIVTLWFLFGRPETDQKNNTKYIDAASELGSQFKEPFNNIKEDTKKLFESEEFKLLEQEFEQMLSTSTNTTTVQE